ncbi:MAG: hypothetical protein HY714_04745 [Candidatus Omnitrophica bacterium]|nr:hypothetical protein [Candidatus Omnitrophota bacterium]
MSERLYRLLFLGSAFVIAAVMIGISRDYGITWDEWMDSNYGSLVLRYFLSFGADRSYLEFWHGYLYSGMFYMITHSLYGLAYGNVPTFVLEGLRQVKNLLPFYTFSHGVNAAFGAAAVIFTGWFAREMAGWRAGWLALIFAAAAPRFFGNSMNNPKDIPLAAAYIFTLTHMLRFFKQLPAPRWGTAAMIATGIAFAIGARPGGMILIPYLVLFSGIFYLDAWRRPEPRMPWTRWALTVVLIVLGGFFGGLLFWPYGQINPAVNPFLAMKELSRFSHWQGVVLFEGELLDPKAIPLWYIPKWIAISTPFFIHAGWAVFFLTATAIARRIDWKILLLAVFAALFPIAYVIAQRSVVMDSWRHLLFVYPPMAAVAAVAWNHLLETAARPRLNRLLWLLLALHVAEPLGWMARNHPHEYTYFNAATGGIRGAFGKYETDYWGNSLRAGAEWLAHYHRKKYGGRPALVRADGSVMGSYPYLEKSLGNLYKPYLYPLNFVSAEPYHFIKYAPLFVREVVEKEPWHYALGLSREWSPADLKNAWPPPGTIHEIKADGVTLCAVIENPAAQAR